jgi:hypothetical protein
LILGLVAAALALAALGLVFSAGRSLKRALRTPGLRPSAAKGA